MPGFELNAMNFTSLNPRESNELFAIKVSYKPSDEPFSLSYFTGIGVYSSTSRGDFIWSEGFIFVVEYYKTINLSRIVVPLGIELNYRMKSISISLSAEAYIADMRPVYTFMLNYTFHI
jgi:hypothetical protein